VGDEDDVGVLLAAGLHERDARRLDPLPGGLGGQQQHARVGVAARRVGQKRVDGRQGAVVGDGQADRAQLGGQLARLDVRAVGEHRERPARGLDRLVEEREGQIDMDAGAVPALHEGAVDVEHEPLGAVEVKRHAGTPPRRLPSPRARS